MTLREAIDRTAARLTPLYDPREARNLARRIVAEYAAAHQDAFPLCLGLSSVFRKLERTGDHLTNIAEEIVFYIDAKVIKHDKARNAAREKDNG